MALIEQAVFTSAETDRAAGYQLVAASAGLSEADARELAVWGPSHASLLNSGPESVSFNFHPLPSGAYCVSRTTPAGFEYSGRGAARVYTQCLIVPADVLGRFANNPFAVLRAASAAGFLEVHQRVPDRLEPLRLVGRAAVVDSVLLTQLASNPGPDRLAALVKAALSSESLATAGDLATEHLVAGLINCLPPECRTEFSFSTGLKYSSRRPFRIVALPGDKREHRSMHQRYNLTLLDLAESLPPEFAPIDGWARFIREVLASGRTSFLATQFSKRRFELACEDLPALGLQLLEGLDISSLPAEPELLADKKQEGPDSGPDWWSGIQRAHAAHRRFEGSGPSTDAKDHPAAPSESPDPDSPETLEKLELLDDLVFEAIGGEPSAMKQLRASWSQLRAELGAELLEETREQYLRHALSIWEGYRDCDGLRDPTKAMQALDVLCVLFDEA